MRPERRNQVWSADFVFDRTADGRVMKCLTIVDDATHEAGAIVPARAFELADGHRFRTLTVIDLFTRECPAIDVGQGLRGQDVAATLERLRFERGLPQQIYCDNGTEFVSSAMDR